MTLGVVVYFAGAYVTASPEAIGANIGAGLIALLASAIVLFGALVALAGIIRQIVVRTRRRHSRSAG